LVCFTEAAAKGIFVLIRHVWHQDVSHAKTYPASRCTQRQVSHVKMSYFDCYLFCILSSGGLRQNYYDYDQRKYLSL